MKPTHESHPKAIFERHWKVNEGMYNFFCLVSNESIGHYHWLQRSLGHIDDQGTKKDSSKCFFAKDYFGFLLHLLFHDYNGLVYDYK
jgi:hypothetical protein